MWASTKRVFVDENGLIHLFRVGNPNKTVCGTFAYKHIVFEQPTCVACIAYWSHPCSEDCAMFNGCGVCEWRGAT